MRENARAYLIRTIVAGALAITSVAAQFTAGVQAQEGATPPVVTGDGAPVDDVAPLAVGEGDADPTMPSVVPTDTVAAGAPITATVAISVAELPAWRLLSPPYSDQTPLPASGKAMYYNPGVMKTVIESRRRFDHIEPCAECIGYVAMLRYGDLDRKVWLQTGPFTVEGPFHVVDAAATQHVDQLLARDWVVDVDYRTAQRWGFRMPWVTVWDEPPLALLLATDAMPLDWDTCRPPTSAFIHSPHSVSVAATLVVVPEQTVKKAIELRHLGAMDFVDAMSDAPDYLYVK